MIYIYHHRFDKFPTNKVALRLTKANLPITSKLQSIAFGLLVFGIHLSASSATTDKNILPSGGHVTSGNLTITQSNNANSAVMNINQSSQKAIIEWNSFDVGKNATVNFNQPNVTASTLNRVNSASQSMINGAINANGQIIFVNPNGVVFGKGAEVNTGGLVVSTMDIKDENYLNENFTFSGNGTGKIINKGRLQANSINGYIALMAPEVRNEGVVSATLSDKNVIALVAGQKVTLTIHDGQLSSYRIDVSALKTLIENKRLIQLNGGEVIIAANSVSDLRSSVINNTGAIKADSFESNGGQISIIAKTIQQSGLISANSEQKQGGNIIMFANQIHLNNESVTSAKGNNNGGQILLGQPSLNSMNTQLSSRQIDVSKTATLDTSAENGNGGEISFQAQRIRSQGTVNSNSENGTGGQISFTGKKIILSDGSKINAIGAVGGGKISVGKTDESVSNSSQIAKSVLITADTKLDASATQNGSGGSIQIWSQIYTSVSGAFSAKGGLFGGNGGNIETSSAGKVKFGSGLKINTNAPIGRVGNWITDPVKLEIDINAANLISSALLTTNVTLDASQFSCGDFGLCPRTVSTPKITFLSGADIYSNNQNTSLSLKAVGGSISINNNITAGQVMAVAQEININGSINTNGGNNSSIYLAAALINIFGNLNSNGNSDTNNGRTSSGNLNTLNTNIANRRRNGLSGLNADTNFYADGSIGGTLNILATGDINLDSNSYISANGATGGSINLLSSNGNINQSGILDAIGLNSQGGYIKLTATNTNILTGSIISTDGFSSGGFLQIGALNNVGSDAIVVSKNAKLSVSFVPTFLGLINTTNSVAPSAILPTPPSSVNLKFDPVSNNSGFDGKALNSLNTGGFEVNGIRISNGKEPNLGNTISNSGSNPAVKSSESPNSNNPPVSNTGKPSNSLPKSSIDNTGKNPNTSPKLSPDQSEPRGKNSSRTNLVDRKSSKGNTQGAKTDSKKSNKTESSASNSSNKYAGKYGSSASRQNETSINANYANRAPSSRRDSADQLQPIYEGKYASRLRALEKYSKTTIPYSSNLSLPAPLVKDGLSIESLLYTQSLLMDSSNRLNSYSYSNSTNGLPNRFGTNDQGYESKNMMSAVSLFFIP